MTALEWRKARIRTMESITLTADRLAHHITLTNLVRLIGTLLLAMLAASLFAGCAGPAGLLVHGTASGRGDVRTDGDILVVVGGLEGNLGVRVAGQPLLILPSFAVREGSWYVRSESRGFELEAPLSRPLPAWTRPLYTDVDLAQLEALGISLQFESPEQS